MDWLTGSNSDRHFFLLAVLVYGVSMVYSVFLWRKGFRDDDRVNYRILLVAFGFHTIGMFKRGLAVQQCPVHNLYEATIFFMWTITLAYLLLGARPRLRYVGAFAAPLLFGLGVFALMPALDPPASRRLELAGSLPSLHAATIMLAYGAFGLSAATGAMFLTQYRQLKFAKARAMFSFFPPIERLDTVAFRMTLGGFILLTIGLVTGDLLPRPEGVSYWKDTKVVWSALLWLLYALLLLGRLREWLSGRRFAYGLIGTFGFLTLTFWGANLLSVLHHQP